MSKGRIFWAIFFIGVGAMVGISAFMEWDVRILSLGAGVLAIALGIVMLIPGKKADIFHSFQHNEDEKSSTHTFSENRITIHTVKKQYTTAFGKSSYDFREVELNEDTVCDLTIVFGEGELLFGEDQAVEINCTTAFGESVIPGTVVSAFGNGNWRSGSIEDGKPVLKINLHTVFGQSTVKI